MAGQNGCCWLERGGAYLLGGLSMFTLFSGTTATATAAIAVAFSVGDIFTHRVRSHVAPPLTADA